MIKRYSTFLVVGIFITISGVFVRAGLGLLLQDDSSAMYALTILLTYVYGIILGFVLHRRVTFSSNGRAAEGHFLRFLGVHLVGMGCTVTISYLLRNLGGDKILPLELSKSLSFAVAAFVASAVTYLLNSQYVFRGLEVEVGESDGTAG